MPGVIKERAGMKFADDEAADTVVVKPDPVDRRELADRLKDSIHKHSRDMGPRTWTRDDLYDRPKRYYQ